MSTRRFATIALLLLAAAGADAAPVPKPKLIDGHIAIVRDGEVVLYQPDGEVAQRLRRKDGKRWQPESTAHPAPTASGIPVAVMEYLRKDHEQWNRAYPSALWLIPSADDEPVAVDVDGHTLHNDLIWSRTGKRLYVTAHLPPDEQPEELKLSYGVGVGKTLCVDPATRKVTDAKLPAGHRVIGERPDGGLVTDGGWAELLKDPKFDSVKNERLFLVSADRKTVDPLKAPKGRCWVYDLSRDGRTLLCQRPDENPDGNCLTLFDVQTGEVTDVTPAAVAKKKVHLGPARWSPDGRRIVFVNSDQTDDPNPKVDYRLTVCDADGGNCRDLLTTKDHGSLRGPDWK